MEDFIILTIIGSVKCVWTRKGQTHFFYDLNDLYTI